MGGNYFGSQAVKTTVSGNRGQTREVKVATGEATETRDGRDKNGDRGRVRLKKIKVERVG